MKLKLIFFLFIALLVNACKNDNPEPHIFKRGQIVNSEKSGTRTTADIKSLLSLYSYSFANQIGYTYDVDLYSIKYETINPDGSETIASGLLAVPAGKSTVSPLLSFQHGTVLKDNLVPSTLALGSGMEIGLIFGTEGYVVCMPDYLGLGDGEGLHPYMHAQSEATAGIDMIRAAQNKLKELGVSINEQLFLLGYSQGGHATMAMHKAIEEDYSDEFTVTASAPMAGPYDVSGIMADIVLRKETYKSSGYLPYMLYSYNSIYHFYDNLEANFKVPYNTSLPPYFDGSNLYSLSDVNNVMPSIPSDILTDEAYNAIIDHTNQKVWDALKENDLYDWVPVAPIRMFHCDGDVTVPIENSQKALDNFVANGVTNAELINPLQGGTHSTCLFPSLLGARNWFNEFIEN
ncbi:MAG: lipase family protein [Bacteroidales bacterium]|nr:lipase family protein [Bacteroidales bacterium]